jgi:hypothetical protein
LAANIGTVASRMTDPVNTFKSATSDGEIDAAAARLVRTASRSTASADVCSSIHRRFGVRSTFGVLVGGGSVVSDTSTTVTGGDLTGASVLGVFSTVGADVLVDGRSLGDRDVGLAVCGSFDGGGPNGDLDRAETVGSADARKLEVGVGDSDGPTDGAKAGPEVGSVLDGLSLLGLDVGLKVESVLGLEVGPELGG